LGGGLAMESRLLVEEEFGGSDPRSPGLYGVGYTGGVFDLGHLDEGTCSHLGLGRRGRAEGVCPHLGEGARARARRIIASIRRGSLR